MTRRTHRSVEIPTISIYCDDAIHADIPAVVAARFGKYPPDVFEGIEGGWHMLSDLYDPSSNKVPFLMDNGNYP
jgi:hypothetical protein